MRIVRSLGALAVLAAVWLAIGMSSVSAAAVVKTIPVGSAPEGVSSDGTHVWVANFGGGTVSEIDASTGTVVKTITVGSDARGGVVGWHPRLGRERATAVRSVRSMRRPARSSTRSRSAATPMGVSSDGTHVWVTNHGGGTVSEIDASTGTVVKTITVGSSP